MNVAIITGASSGIGKELAKRLDNKNLDCIYLIARRLDRLNSLSLELKTKSIAIPLDLSNDIDLEKYSSFLKSNDFNIKYLVNSAGFGRFGNYEEVDVETSVSMIDINCKALVYVTMNSLSKMSSGSHIINIGSASAFYPLINFNVYASTKAFVVHYSNALHDELKSRNVSCTVCCPGWVKTDFFDIAKNDEFVHGPKKYKPMLDVNQVCNKIIKSTDKSKKFCIYNSYTKLHRFLSRHFPFIISNGWKKMQKK